MARILNFACILLVGLAWLGECHRPASGQISPFAKSEPASEWLTGSKLENGLRNRVSISWTTYPFRDSLLDFAAHQGVAIFVDRRVDPSQTLTLRVDNHTVFETINRIADQTECGICRLGNTIYFGPRNEVSELVEQRSRLIQQLKNQSAGIRRQYLSAQELSWPRLSQPNDIWRNQVFNGDLIEPDTQLPHDLWPAYQLPEMAWLDRVLLLATGFGKRAEFDQVDQRLVIRLEPWPDPTRADRKLRLELANSELDYLKSKFPASRIHRVRRHWIAQQSTPLEAYDYRRAIEAYRADRTQPSRNGGEVRVSVPNTTTSIGGLLTSIANQLNVELQYDPQLRPALTEQIEIKNVKQVTYVELIAIALQGTQLEFQLTDKNLIIRRKQ